MKGHLRGLADELLEAFGIFNTRNLQKDSVVTLALNGRFAHARFVDTATNDFQGLGQRGCATFCEGVACKRDADGVAVDLRPRSRVNHTER